MYLSRCRTNPILQPDTENEWESFATFNGNVVFSKGVYHMFYRAISDFRRMERQELRMSSIGHAVSADGIHFERRGVCLRPELPWDRFGCEDPRATLIDETLVLFYTGIGAYPFVPDHIRVGVALLNDFEGVAKRHLVTPFNAKAMSIFPKKVNGKYTVTVTVNTDMPPAVIAIAQFDELEQIWNRDFWRQWYLHLDQNAIDLKRIDTDQVEVGAAPILTDEGWLLIYCRIQNYGHPSTIFGIEAALLDLDDPRKIIARSSGPLLTPAAGYEIHGTVPNVIFPSGALVVGEELRIYYGGADTVCALATCHLPTMLAGLTRQSCKFPRLVRSVKNPILTARWNCEWERLGVYNPGTIAESDVTKIIYRAQDNEGTSRFGLASIRGDGELIERSQEPIYGPREHFEDKAFANGFSGCEDPRLTIFGDHIYMLYTAYRGDSPPRVALTSIAVRDFSQRNWQNWNKPILISPPGVADKDACFFPEKIRGKYVTIHRIEPDIVFDFRNELDFDGHALWLQVHGEIPPRKNSWEGVKIGANSPPIKTESGWILLYHGVGTHDHHYRLGALLLDLEKPTKIIGRTIDPILQPEDVYEKYGQVRNVVFPCGVSLQKGVMQVFYGAADTYTCMASVELEVLVQYLKHCGDAH